MFDEDLPKSKTNAFPRNLESLSIDELNDYIEELKTEIERAQSDIKAKQASQAAAADIFKS